MLDLVGHTDASQIDRACMTVYPCRRTNNCCFKDRSKLLPNTCRNINQRTDGQTDWVITTVLEHVNCFAVWVKCDYKPSSESVSFTAPYFSKMWCTKKSVLGRSRQWSATWAPEIHFFICSPVCLFIYLVTHSLISSFNSWYAYR